MRALADQLYKHSRISGRRESPPARVRACVRACVCVYTNTHALLFSPCVTHGRRGNLNSIYIPLTFELMASEEDATSHANTAQGGWTYLPESPYTHRVGVRVWEL